jgi:hypothetical protein
MPEVIEHSVKAEAEFLYCIKQLAATEIATRLGISVPTVRRWAKENKWQEYLRLHAVSPYKIANDLYAEIERIKTLAVKEDRTLNNGEVDRIVKLVKSAKQISKPAEYASIVIDIMDRFSSWLKNEAPALHDQCARHIIDFARTTTSELST